MVRSIFERNMGSCTRSFGKYYSVYTFSFFNVSVYDDNDGVNDGNAKRDYSASMYSNTNFFANTLPRILSGVENEIYICRFGIYGARKFNNRC